MDSRDAIIEDLRSQVAQLTALVEKQAGRIAELELQLAQAKEDSSTSSQPPSSEIAKPKPKQRRGTSRQASPGWASGA